jgi:hypothetical protein
LRLNSLNSSDTYLFVNIFKNRIKNDNLPLIQIFFDAIVNEFNWKKINGEYLQLFEECYSKSNKRK